MADKIKPIAAGGSNALSALTRLKNEGSLNLLKRGAATSPAEGSATNAEIELSKICRDPDQPRKAFDSAKLQSLADSIKAQGVLQAITVQPADESGLHKIIMGERRYQAAQLAGLRTIPAIVKTLTGDLRAAQLTENVQRADLTTAEIAKSVIAMREAGQSRADIAKAMGWSAGIVSGYFAVADMPEDLQALAEHSVTVRTLSDLFAIWKKDAEAVRDFLGRTEPEGITRGAVEALRKSLEGGQEAQGGDTPTVPAAEGQRPASGPEVELQADSGQGQGAEVGKREEAQPPESVTGPEPSEKNAAETSPQPVKANVAIICKVGDDVGRILTDAVAVEPKSLVVSFDNGKRLLDVPLDQITLVDVIAL